VTNFIDVEIVIDTVSLLKDFPSPSQNSNSPTMINHTSYSYMVAATKFVGGGQASGNLIINALNNDVIRWRCLSLSGNTDTSAVVYGINAFSGPTVTNPPIAIISEPYGPLPILQNNQNTSPPTFAPVIENDYFLQATVTGHGTEQYNVFFYVTSTDQTTGKPKLVGYFGWDPTISVP
jgi:hypothetical protein